MNKYLEKLSGAGSWVLGGASIGGAVGGLPKKEFRNGKYKDRSGIDRIGGAITGAALGGVTGLGLHEVFNPNVLYRSEGKSFQHSSSASHNHSTSNFYERMNKSRFGGARKGGQSHKEAYWHNSDEHMYKGFNDSMHGGYREPGQSHKEAYHANNDKYFWEDLNNIYGGHRNPGETYEKAYTRNSKAHYEKRNTGGQSNYNSNNNEWKNTGSQSNDDKWKDFWKNSRQSGKEEGSSPFKRGVGDIHSLHKDLEFPAEGFTTKDNAIGHYRKISMKNHPDRGGKVEDMQRINAAWGKYKVHPEGLQKLAGLGIMEKVYELVVLSGGKSA